MRATNPEGPKNLIRPPMSNASGARSEAVSEMLAHYTYQNVSSGEPFLHPDNVIARSAGTASANMNSGSYQVSAAGARRGSGLR